MLSCPYSEYGPWRWLGDEYYISRTHGEWEDQYVLFGQMRLAALERKQLNDLCDPEEFEKLR